MLSLDLPDKGVNRQARPSEGVPAKTSRFASGLGSRRGTNTGVREGVGRRMLGRTAATRACGGAINTSTIHAAPIAFSVEGVAELLGCSTDTVRRMIRSGRLKAIQPLGKGGRVFVGRSSIERLFDSAAADPTEH